MADAKPTQKPESTPRTKLAPASESSDPAVHQLLAQRQAAQMNEDNDELRRINKELADLGYE
ncbi:MAG TPA: hypothetical protein VIQ30_26795 [Pseudonocardia sp.]